MKKLVFTAIAAIAFSGVSMAKTKDVQCTQNYEMIIPSADSCQTFAMDFIDEYDARHPGEEMDQMTANNVYLQLLEVCYNMN